MKNKTRVYGGETQVPFRLVRKLHAMVDSAAKELAPIYAGLRWPWATIDKAGLAVPKQGDIAKMLLQLLDATESAWIPVDVNGTARWRQASGGLAVVVELEHDNAAECWEGRLEFTRSYSAYLDSDDEDGA